MWDSLADWLMTLVREPLLYLTFVLIISILNAIILPMPVEVVLLGYLYYLMEPESSFLGLGIAGSFILISVVMGVGKAIGSWLVFHVGIKAEGLINKYMSWRWFRRLMGWTEKFCIKYGYVGVFIVMSIPVMTDTVPLYAFSIANREGNIYEKNMFVFTNMWAGISRTLLVGIIAVIGVMSFGYGGG